MVLLARGHTETIQGGRVAVADFEGFRTSAELSVIENVNVLAPDGQSFRAGHNVVIDQGRIVSVASDSSAPAGARRIDGKSGYLIPGLIDAQVDLRRQPNDLLLYLANGITGVRDLSGHEDDRALAVELERGRPGPALLVASPRLVNRGLIGGLWETISSPRINVRHAGRAPAAVQSLGDRGYDVVHVGDGFDPVTYRAVIDAAAGRNIPTLAPLPDGARARLPAQTAPTEIKRIELLVDDLLEAYPAQASPSDPAAFLAFVEARADDLAADLEARGTAIGTALWFSDSLARQAGDLVELLRELPLAHANPAMVEGSRYAGVGWLPGMNRYEVPRDLDQARRAATMEVWRMRSDAQKILLRAFSRGGVTIVAGSRATDELMVPGFSLHDELRTLHESGLTTAEALRAATAASSEVIGLSSGVIEAGRPADLVLLRENPLSDINNSRSIEAVFRAGRLHDRAALDGMLDAVLAAHADSRKFELSRYQ